MVGFQIQQWKEITYGSLLTGALLRGMEKMYSAPGNKFRFEKKNAKGVPSGGKLFSKFNQTFGMDFWGQVTLANPTLKHKIACALSAPSEFLDGRRLVLTPPHITQDSCNAWAVPSYFLPRVGPRELSMVHGWVWRQASRVPPTLSPTIPIPSPSPGAVQKFQHFQLPTAPIQYIFSKIQTPSAGSVCFWCHLFKCCGPHILTYLFHSFASSSFMPLFRSSCLPRAALAWYACSWEIARQSRL
jgi:hypothetical protein